MLLRRVWHFVAGHPVADVWNVDGGLECEGCGKSGGRL